MHFNQYFYWTNIHDIIVKTLQFDISMISIYHLPWREVWQIDDEEPIDSGKDNPHSKDS